jgi:uncharacterized tellurite resistance protein B-like protein
MLKRFADALFGNPQPNAGREPLCIQLATCVILVEAARADNDFTQEERDHIVGALQARFGLSTEEAEDLIEQATIEGQASSDLWKFTNTINQTFSNEEKKEVVEEVWRVVYSDEELDGHEDHLMHKLQKLLNLNHPTLIEAKMKVLEEIRSS